jgi:hypothetical protein
MTTVNTFEPVFSILHASKGRPEKALAARRMWFDRAKDPSRVEYIMILNAGDPACDQIMSEPAPKFGRSLVFTAMVSSSAPAWNAGAGRSTGDLLIQAQDDVEPMEAWDTALLDRLERRLGLEWADEKAVVAVSDGYRKDGLLCTAICTRPYYNHEGFFLDPAFASVFSDDSFSIRAYGQAADNECFLIGARELVFRHQHHYHVKDDKGNALVPWDDTYRDQNAPERYTAGKRLFEEKNARYINRGFKTW